MVAKPPSFFPEPRKRPRPRRVLRCVLVLLLFLGLASIVGTVLFLNTGDTSTSPQLVNANDAFARHKSWRHNQILQETTQKPHPIRDQSDTDENEVDLSVMPTSILQGLSRHQKMTYDAYLARFLSSGGVEMNGGDAESGALALSWDWLPKLKHAASNAQKDVSDQAAEGSDLLDDETRDLDQEESDIVAGSERDNSFDNENANDDEDDKSEDDAAIDSDISMQDQEDDVPDLKSQSEKPPSNANAFKHIRHFEDLAQLAQAADMPVQFMREMIKSSVEKGMNLEKDALDQFLTPKQPKRRESELWSGDQEFLFKQGKPTCFGQECTRSEYINAKLNMTTLSTSQHMSTYWQHVDVSKISYFPLGSLLSNCYNHLCGASKQNNCDIPFNTTKLDAAATRPIIRKLTQLLKLHGKTHSHSHCIASMMPAQSFHSLTNFTPLVDGTIGDPVKRARFVGDGMCNIMNASSNDMLHYIGVHQCPKARQILIPVPKAVPAKLAQPPRTKSGRRKKLPHNEPLAPEPLIARYMKIDKKRNHQFHNPVLISLRHAFISQSGHVSTDRLVVHPDPQCAQDTMPPSLAPSTNTRFYKHVFAVGSHVNEQRLASHGIEEWVWIQVMPRIATYLKELDADREIRVHVTGGQTGVDAVARALRFLGLLSLDVSSNDVNSSRVQEKSVAARVITGPALVGIVHVPEPSVSCFIPGEWQVQTLRDTVAKRLLSTMRGLERRSWKEILVLVPSGLTGRLSNQDAMVRMISKEFRGYTVHVLERDAMPPIDESLAYFHAARVIVSVGEGGSGLSYLVASQVGAGLIEVLKEPKEKSGWDFVYSSLARFLGVVWYGMVEELNSDGSRVVELVHLHAVITAVINDVK
ncbi:hypothetical protein HDU77_011093 [Chytriomyces hyalinus]|nr:hypothetical protein HDU77_011093 [Chytriomyces hyalinus]